MHFGPAESLGSAPGQPAASPEYSGPSPLAPGAAEPGGLRGRSSPRRLLSVPRPGAAASEPLSGGSPRPGPNALRQSPLASAACCQPGAQPTLPGLLVAPRYSQAPRDRRGSGLLQLQLLREAKAKLPRDTLLNLKGTGLWKTPFSLIEAGSFQLGLYLVSFAGNPSARAGTEKGQFRVLVSFLYGYSWTEAGLTGIILNSRPLRDLIYFICAKYGLKMDKGRVEASWIPVGSHMAKVKGPEVDWKKEGGKRCEWRGSEEGNSTVL